jgi:glutathione S-transferase
MIAKVGLLNPKSYNPDNKEQAYRLGIAAWCKSKGVTLQGAGQLTDIATHFLGFVQSFFASQLRPDSLIPDIKIKSVAVWDTVGSMGIPVYAADARYDLFRFTDTGLSAQVQNGFHAMSIDELRIDFPVTRWDDRQGIRQVWFAGAHSDVGGGYSQAESGLSDIGLDWMMKQLAEVGVSFATPLTYNPRAQFDQAIHEPWKNPPFDLLQTSSRQVQPADSIHDSVKERWRKFGAYRPVAMAAWAQKNVA